MALRDDNQQPICFVATVVGARDLAAGLRRITLHAPEFTEPGFYGRNEAGYDEFFGLLLPPAGEAVHLPEEISGNVRAAVSAMPEQIRPTIRWYTIRKCRPEIGEVDVDIVTHGDSGPGSAWALGAQAGDEVGFFVANRIWGFVGEVEGPVLLVVDPTAVPAVFAIAERLANDGKTLASWHLVVADLGDGKEEPGLERAAESCASFTRVVTNPGDAPETLQAWLEEEAPEGLRNVKSAWICGENSLVKAVRRVVVRQWGVPKERVAFPTYWILGQPRG